MMYLYFNHAIKLNFCYVFLVEFFIHSSHLFYFMMYYDVMINDDCYWIEMLPLLASSILYSFFFQLHAPAGFALAVRADNDFKICFL